MSLMIIKPKAEALAYTNQAETRFASHVEYPEAGGILSYFIGHKYPEKQLVYPEVIYALDPLKRGTLNLLKLFTSCPQATILAMFSQIIPGGKSLRKLTLDLYTNFLETGLNKIMFSDPIYFCDSAREIYRAGMQLIKEDLNDEQNYKTLLLFVCLFWEYDNAYRYRGQDIAEVLNKKFFDYNPIKEMRRILAIGMARECGEGLDGKYKMIGKLVGLALMIPRIKKVAKRFVEILDKEKLHLDKNDLYWTLHRSDYSVHGKSLDERMFLRSAMQK